METAKTTIRNLAVGYRTGLTSKRWHLISKRIQNHALDFVRSSAVKRIGCYLSVKDKREVETDHILSILLAEGYAVAVPRVVDTQGIMEMVQITTATDFCVSSWGIPEPQQGSIVNPEWIEMIVIPMIAGDFQGTRLGYGKGFYDRYLSGAPAKRIGLCNFDNVFLQIPCEIHDQPVDCIITEQGLIRMPANGLR